MPSSDICSDCGAKLGRGGIGQEDGSLLCANCDSKRASSSNSLNANARLEVKFFDANNASLVLNTQGNHQHGEIAIFTMLLSKVLAAAPSATVDDKAKVFVNSLGSMRLVALHDHPSIPRICEGLDAKPAAAFIADACERIQAKLSIA
jgi:hypothetical protein